MNMRGLPGRFGFLLMILLQLAPGVCAWADDDKELPMSGEEQDELSIKLADYQKQLDEILKKADAGDCKIGDADEVAKKIALLYKKLNPPEVSSPFKDCFHKALGIADFSGPLAQMRKCVGDEPKRLGRTDDELVALWAYNGNSFNTIDQALRANGDANAKECAAAVTAALKKLPVSPKHVLKGTTNVPLDLVEHKGPGDVLTNPTFTRVRSQGGYMGYSYGTIRATIYSKTGKTIEPCPNQGADVTVIEPGAKFKILDKREGMNGNQPEYILIETD
jgi:hypothetical protein